MRTVLKSNARIYKNFPVMGLGRLGGFFQYANSNDIYGISNNHVIAGSDASIGQEIFSADGTKDSIGTLQFWYEMDSGPDNEAPDIAFFKLNPDVVIPEWIVRPTYFATPEVGLEVQIHLSGENKGIVTQINQPVSITVASGTFSYNNVMTIKSKNSNPFSIPGDSGSLVYCGDDFIVGILVGGSASHDVSYVFPFDGAIFTEDFKMQIANV